MRSVSQFCVGIFLMEVKSVDILMPILLSTFAIRPISSGNYQKICNKQNPDFWRYQGTTEAAWIWEAKILEKWKEAQWSKPDLLYKFFPKTFDDSQKLTFSLSRKWQPRIFVSVMGLEKPKWELRCRDLGEKGNNRNVNI